MACTPFYRGLLSLILLFTGWTAAFIPTIGYSVGGLLGTSHYSMTQEAIEALDLEFFSKNILTATMARARDQIANANALVDETDEHNAPSHFDGESFEDGQDRLIDLRKKAKASLKAGDGFTARQYVGQALHTVQDFYSHTNWIEMGNTDVNRDALGLETGANVIPRPPQSLATCVNCGGPSRDEKVACQNTCKVGSKGVRAALWLISCAIRCEIQDCSRNLVKGVGLTSGYYGGEGPKYTKPGNHKCSHGGIFDDSAQGVEGINKDSISFDLSPHGPEYHRQAVRVALEATKDFIRAFKDDPEVKPEELKLLLGLGPSIAFAIDTTGSMEDVIAGVRSQAIQILETKLETKDEPILYILSQIQDPDTGLIESYTDVLEFERAIRSLGSGGGGDCEELAMSAIRNAVQASDEGGSVFAFTDAGASDLILAAEVANLARRKRVKVFPFLFPSECSSSAGFDTVAAASGGKIFSLSSTTEAGDATDLADSMIRSDAVEIMSVDVSSSSSLRKRAGSADYAVPVDSDMTQLSFSLSGTKARLNLKKPDGTSVSPSDLGVTTIDLSGGQLVTIDSPEVGEWTATVIGNSTYSLSAAGVSPLHLSNFNFVQMRGRPGHQGWFPTDNIPPRGSLATSLASIDGNFTSAHFEYRSVEGIVIGSLDLSNGGGNTDDPVASNVFYGNVTVPTSNFTLYLVGEDAYGAAFQRVLPATFLYHAANGTSNGTTTVSAGPGSSTGVSSWSISLSYTRTSSSVVTAETSTEDCRTKGYYHTW